MSEQTIKRSRAVLERREYVAGLSISLWRVNVLGIDIFEILADSRQGELVHVATLTGRARADQGFAEAVTIWRLAEKERGGA